MQWMANQAPNHPQVVNMSLGGGAIPALGGAATSLQEAGTLTVAAAGNMGNCNNIGSPAGFSEVLAVGSLTADATTNKMSSFSSGGKALNTGLNKPDVVAQGEAVNSAWIGSTTAYRAISGTSMASPAVAGVAALVFSARPDLNPADVAEILRRTANGDVSNGKCAAPNSFGNGLVDASKAVAEAKKLPVRKQ